MSTVFDFKGKVVLISGSSSGIGAATALLFVKSGANVVVTGRNTDNLSEVAKQCREVAQNNCRVLEVVADISQENDCKRLVMQTIETFGRLDILINNAGIARMALINDSDYINKYNEIMETNLNSVVLLTHLCVEYLAKTKGNIINVSTNLSKISWRSFSPYFVSKAAIDMFTQCMAAELGSKGIRVNVIHPGVVKTKFMAVMGLDNENIEDYWHTFSSQLPMSRVGEGVDIANAILYLASDNSSFITGSGLVSDGGQLVANIQI